MSSADTFDVVRPYDMEVVAHADQTVLAEYSATRDMKLLKLPQEARPITFRCRYLSRAQRRKVRAMSAQEDQLEMAFRYGLIDIRNIDGTKTWSADRAKDDAPLSEKALDTLESMGLGETDFEDIGAAILGLSFLAKGVRPRCPVPRSSAHACVESISLHAELLRDSQK